MESSDTRIKLDGTPLRNLYSRNCSHREDKCSRMDATFCSGKAGNCSMGREEEEDREGEWVIKKVLERRNGDWGEANFMEKSVNPRSDK
mmetsp:Transcript_1444/g.2156  ORF Transcript_1444/g.2156 Transcript_1444/m.2156 type:complete len:89 (+) Transcript_1444:541-807(+)